MAADITHCGAHRGCRKQSINGLWNWLPQRVGTNVRVLPPSLQPCVCHGFHQRDSFAVGEQKSSLTSPVAALSNPGWTAAVGMILGETARASNVDLSTPVPVLKHLPCLNDCEFIPFNHASVSCSSPLTEMVYGRFRYPPSTHCQRIRGPFLL